MTLRVVTVKASGGDYSSLNAALVGEQANLVSLNRQLRVDCYPFTDTTAVNAGGGSWNTSPTYNVTVRAVADHGGVWNASAYILSAASFPLVVSLLTGVRCEGLQVELTATGSAAVTIGSNSSLFTRGIVRCTAGRPGTTGISDSAVSLTVTNTIVYGFDSGFFLSTGVAYNCTAAACSINFAQGTFINCLSQAHVSSGFQIGGTYGASSDYNVSSGSTAPGAHSRTNQTATFRGASDYHLAASDTAARGYGTNLNALGVTDDIDGAERHGTWDVGADQYVAPTGWTLNDLTPLPVTESFAAPATAFSQRADIAPLAMLLETPVTVVNVTGTASTATAPETATLSSREVITGSATSATSAETSALTGAERIIGTASTATAPETSALASVEVVTGSATTSTTAETTSATGREVMTGALTSATAPETSTLASTEVLTGTIASATAPETSGATGREVITGTIASATAPETSTLASTEVVTGTVASADAAQTSALAGAEAVVGLLATGTAPETATLASTEVITGAVTTAGDAETSDLAGLEVIAGVVDSENATETTTLASAEVVTGSIASGDDAETSELTGAVTVPDGSIVGAIESAQDAQSSDATGLATAPDVPVVPTGGGGIVHRPQKRPGFQITVTPPPAVTAWVIPPVRVVLGPTRIVPAPARSEWIVPAASVALGDARPALTPAVSRWVALTPRVVTAPAPDDELLVLSLADGTL